MNGPREQRLEQFARFPVRLLAAVRPERLGLLAVLILRCHQGRNYLRHQAEFALADLSRDLGWENENTSRTECNAARQMLRRWMYDFHDKSLIQVTVGEGREARWTVRLTGALVQNADVTFVSRSDGPPMSGSAMPAIARPEPDYALGPEPECHVPDQAESHVPVTFGEPDVTFGARANPHAHSGSTTPAEAECHVSLDGRTTEDLSGEEELDQDLSKGTPAARSAIAGVDALLADLRQAREHEPVRITLVPEDAETEALLAAEIAELTADGLLEAVSASALCRYARHRHVGTDWTTREGRTVCGVCHPPVPGAAT